MSRRSWGVGLREAFKASAGVWALLQTLGLVALIALVIYLLVTG